MDFMTKPSLNHFQNRLMKIYVLNSFCQKCDNDSAYIMSGGKFFFKSSFESRL